MMHEKDLYNNFLGMRAPRSLFDTRIRFHMVIRKHNKGALDNYHTLIQIASLNPQHVECEQEEMFM